jgi:hypothetical protein
MEARLDTPFEHSGKFNRPPDGSPAIHGRLLYAPEKGVELELVENPEGPQPSSKAGVPPVETMFGHLVDGTPVTLSGCFVSKARLTLGNGIGSPTTLVVNRALFGRQVAALDRLPVKRYSMELSSLANWSCTSPVKSDTATVNGRFAGFNVTCRTPASIDVPLPNKAFDVQITHAITTQDTACAFTITWRAAVAIVAHDSLSLETINHIAWQCQNLMSLLIGEPLSVRAINISGADEPPCATPDRALALVYHQVGKHARGELHPARMLLPYGQVKDKFPDMVERWFSRSEQAVLATNVLFGLQNLESPAVNLKFLLAAQAAESYHRSLPTGLYMDQGLYDAAVQELASHMPDAIQGDHRRSLKNRLKYGNEYSLRKRLAGLFDRIPENSRQRIAGDVDRFIDRVVDTRNYYTHYDNTLQDKAFACKDAYVVAGRLHILVTANLLHDLGIKDENLLPVLEQNREFVHWMSEVLPL